MNFNEVKYILGNTLKGNLVITEPTNWREIARDNIRKELEGVFTELTGAITFVKEAKKYIEDVYNLQGTQGEITLTIQRKPDYKKAWETSAVLFLDLKTLVINDYQLEINAITGGLKELIESQYKEEYELERDTDINGNTISDLDNLKTLYWEGRKILIESLLKQNQSVDIFQAGYSQNRVINFVCLPLQVKYTAFDRAFSQNNFNSFDAGGNGSNYNASRIFYFSPNEGNQVDLNINVNFTISGEFVQNIAPSTKQILFRLVKLQSNEDINSFSFDPVNDVTTLLSLNGTQTDVGNTYNIDFNETITLNQFECLSLVAQLGGIPGSGAYTYIAQFSDLCFDVKIDENSFFEPSFFDKTMFTIHNAFQRMIEIITGDKNNFKSDYLLNGDFKNLLLCSGKKLRGFPIKNNETNNIDSCSETNEDFEQIAVTKITLEQLMSVSVFIDPLSWGIENINGKQVVRVEPKDYFLDTKNVINLGEGGSLITKVSPERLYKSLAFGNSKIGDYENAIGNTEYNTYNTFSTPLTRSEGEYKQDSALRHDAVGAEIQRRKPYLDNKNEDEKYDDNNFIIDCKILEDEVLTPRTWQDDFAEEPTVYDPNSAINLRLSAFNCLKRHAPYFKSGMEQFTNSFIRYKSTKGQSNVTIGGQNEDGTILISDLSPTLVSAENIETTLPITTEIRQKLKGNTNSKENLNYLFNFVYKNQQYYGFIKQISETEEMKVNLIRYK